MSSTSGRSRTANAAANTVAENAGVGTTVGLTGLASDADATATITYSLDDNAGGRFAIHATTGVVTVNAALDYETATSHSVTIRATSSDGSYSTQSFTIAVTDVNESGITAISDTDGAGRLRAGERGQRHGRGPDGLRRRSGRHGYGQLLAGRQRGRAVCHPRHDRRGDGGRRDQPRGGRQLRHHGPSHQQRHDHHHPHVHHHDRRRGRVRRGRRHRHQRHGQCRQRERRERHDRRHHGRGQRRRCHDQHDHLQPAEQRRRTVCDRRQHGRGDRRRSARPRSGRRQPQHHGPRHLGRRLLHRSGVSRSRSTTSTSSTPARSRDTNATANAVNENAANGTAGRTSRPPPATRTPPPTRSPTACRTTTADGLRSTPTRAW